MDVLGWDFLFDADFCIKSKAREKATVIDLVQTQKATEEREDTR